MWYCSSCLHEHQQLIGNQHDLFINDLVGKCAKHNQAYNIFCLKCKAHICGLCLLQDHKGHEFVDLKEMLNIDNFIEIYYKSGCILIDFIYALACCCHYVQSVRFGTNPG